MKNLRYCTKAKDLLTNKWNIGTISPDFNHIYQKTDSGIKSIEIDARTICQCTEALDTNENVIWENDIVQCNYGIGKVIWQNSQWQVMFLKHECTELIYKTFPLSQFKSNILEMNIYVIGNIFDGYNEINNENKEEQNIKAS